MRGLFPLVNREKSVLLETCACYNTNTGSLTWLCSRWHPSKPLFIAFHLPLLCQVFLSSLSTTWSFFLSKVFSGHRGSHSFPPSWCIHSPDLDSVQVLWQAVLPVKGWGHYFIPGERAMLPILRYFCLIRRDIPRHSTFHFISWWFGQVFVLSMY